MHSIFVTLLENVCVLGCRWISLLPLIESHFLCTVYQVCGCNLRFIFCAHSEIRLIYV